MASSTVVKIAPVKRALLQLIQVLFMTFDINTFIWTNRNSSQKERTDRKKVENCSLTLT